jgi:ferrochelatase
MRPILLVNFGGPRNLDEIAPFLKALLCDPDVIRPFLPLPIHNWFFQRVARKRALKLREDYLEIGGKSPIYFDTEAIGEAISKRLNVPVYTFHRYLPQTHAAALQAIKAAGPLTVLPLFPQFSFATTGSIARVLSSCDNLHWIQSYATHPAFIQAHKKRISHCLKENGLLEEETTLLFSAHGLPQKFVDEGDPYQQQCIASCKQIAKEFSKALHLLSYQSKFGKGKWLEPATEEMAKTVPKERKNVIFIPLSFTSDHIETLFEIEKLYMPSVIEQGLNAYRCPALNQEPYWIDALIEILEEKDLQATEDLIRK